MISLSSLITSGVAIPQNVSQLRHYSTNEGRALPADAAPIGVLADGSVYFDAYLMLTPSDIAFLKKVTGRSFDPETIVAEKAAGTFQGDPLAAAIGEARADNIHGWGGLSGDVNESFLQSIKSAMSNPQGDGTYQGYLISQAELATAFSVFGHEPRPTVDLSA